MTTTTDHRPPSWTTKNAAGLHGNTCPGRLRLLDTALELLQIYPFGSNYCRDGDDANGKNNNNNNNVVDVIVDVGMGDQPWTTLELAQTCCAAVRVIGTEVDVDRLKHAQQSLLLQRQQHDAADTTNNTTSLLERISLRAATTDFALPLLQNNNNDHGVVERPVVVRAMNVLRDYTVPDAMAALRTLYHQVAPCGGVLVEGSADTDGRLVVALLLQPQQRTKVEDHHPDDSDNDDEQEIFISAVIFTADLVALASDPDYSCLPPAKWFNRHNHLPRLYRGFCDASECSRDQTPAWALPMRLFLEQWEHADTLVDWNNNNNNNTTTAGTRSVAERFVRGATVLRAQKEEMQGSVLVDWAHQGILVWYPADTELVLPDVEEWFYFRQRISK